jgi:hypothetical protein
LVAEIISTDKAESFASGPLRDAIAYEMDGYIGKSFRKGKALHGVY